LKVHLQWFVVVDDLEKGQDGDGSNLTAENLEKLNASKDGLAKGGSLSHDKLKSIMSFLDEVQVSDRLSEIDTVSRTSFGCCSGHFCV
jgi:hypothetical protein